MEVEKTLKPNDYIILKGSHGEKIEIATNTWIKISVKTIDIKNYEKSRKTTTNI